MLDELIREAQQALIHFSFIRFVTDKDVTDQGLKLRLVIDSGMFIQVYANAGRKKVSFTLVNGGQRIFGRDCDGGGWHAHPFDAPDAHNFEGEAGKAATLTDFLFEVEDILLSHGMI
jgi:hypothetical protein